MTFSLILLSHWIGDFAFQSTDMALKKCYSLKWLLFHVGTYTSVLLVFSLFLFSLEDALWYVGFNGFLHFITDFMTSKVINKYRQVPRKLFPLIGFDQLIHTLTLYWTLQVPPQEFLSFIF